MIPDASSDRCKVVIEGCQLNSVYKVVVAAIPQGGLKCRNILKKKRFLQSHIHIMNCGATQNCIHIPTLVDY